MIPADTVLAALDGGKLIKVVAHETGLRVGQVKYIARNPRAKRAELRLSIDETILSQMSRVGKMPIRLPKGVDVAINDDQISVKGANGTLTRPLHALVATKFDAGVVSFVPANASPEADAMSGTMRALVANMVDGVSKGFEKKLTLVGVGFRAAAQGAKLNLQIGFSHPVVKDMPAGISVATATPTEIVNKGADRQVVGQLAAEVRAIRPPEPYKGKGIRYQGEQVRRKAGKTGAK